ncbi:MAG: hypothetical protein FGM16_06785 [Flavobacterium sp.]|nr:hypothetical protein [Flavobacterium sp.]
MENNQQLPAKKNNHFSVKVSNVGFNIKDVDMKSRTVTGVLNTYNFVDSDQDVLLMGSAKKSINDRGPESNATAKIKFAKFHDLTLLPGRFSVLSEREINGKQVLYFEAQMSNSQLGTDTLHEYMDGVIDNHSIGFQYIPEQMKLVERDGQHGNSKTWDALMAQLINPKAAEEKGYVWVIKEIKLWEGSAVAFGANALTPFLGMAKNMTKESIIALLHCKIQKMESVLRNGQQSDDAMVVIEQQSLQLRQLIDDLEPHINITSPKDEIIIKPTEEEVKQALNGSDLAKKFTL